MPPAQFANCDDGSDGWPILGHMSRDGKTPDEHVAQTRVWKADLRSTPEGEAEYQEMCAKAVDATNSPPRPTESSRSTP